MGSERNKKNKRFDKLAILESLLIFLIDKIEKWMKSCGRKNHEKEKPEEISNDEESEGNAKLKQSTGKKGLAIIDSD